MSSEQGSKSAAVIDNPVHYYWPGLTEEESYHLDQGQLAIAERRMRISRLYLGRRTYKQIVDEVGCSVGTVSKDVNILFDWWRKVAVRNVGEHIVAQLMKLDQMEREFEEAWQKSKGEYTETTTGQRGKGQSANINAVIKKKQKYGDPKLGALMLKCWENRCRLLGLMNIDPAATDMLPPVKYVAGLDPVEAA